ncbi:MAG TPA: thiamine phosphate synthase, partial [Rhizomicrobium sp.]|nr:thiamine phosphate synthase [Rhizomicrobium sp.]
IQPPRAYERARQHRQMDDRPRKEGGLILNSKKSASKPAPPRPLPRLYLATPAVDDPQALAKALPSLLAEADVAAVLLRLEPSDPRTLISRIKLLAPLIQDTGAALLLDGHVDLVARSGADGAHLSGIAALEEALATLKPDRIAGVGDLATRHDAMTAGELGADYVLFGEPDEHGQRPSTAAIAERLQWWDELFELPSVGFSDALEEVSAFATAGADFILVGDFVWSAPEGPVRVLRVIAEAIRKGHAARRAKAEAPPGP